MKNKKNKQFNLKNRKSKEAHTHAISAN